MQLETVRNERLSLMIMEGVDIFLCLDVNYKVTCTTNNTCEIAIELSSCLTFQEKKV